MRAPLTPPAPHRWTLSDGYVAAGRIWNSAANEESTHPSNRPAYLYFHGIQSHGGWFEWSASRLGRHGEMVALPDRRGSGRNQEGRGDTPSLERWLLDVDEIAAWVQRASGAARLRVVGVSWGGKLALAHALRHPDRVERLLLVTPGFFPAVGVSLRQRVRIAGSLVSNPCAEYEIPLNDPELFTDNPDAQAFIAADPLKLTRATARFLWHSTRLDRWIRRRPDGALAVPTTLVLAGQDRIIRNEPTQAWCRRVCAAGLKVVRLEREVHTLEFSRDVSAFGQLLDEWAAGR